MLGFQSFHHATIQSVYQGDKLFGFPGSWYPQKRLHWGLNVVPWSTSNTSRTPLMVYLYHHTRLRFTRNPSEWMPRYGTWKAAISTVFIQSLCLYNYTAYIYTTSTSTLAFTCFIWAFPHFDTNSTGGASLRSPTSWRSLVWYLYESPKALAQTLVVDFLG